MKRIFLCFLLAAVIGGLVFAQAAGEGSQGGRAPASNGSAAEQKAIQEKLTLSGKLGIDKGMISLENNGVIWHIRGLGRLVGFIDGLKEGATVTLEGFAVNPPRFEEKFLRVNKLTLNGKDYDVGVPALTRNRGAGQVDKQGKSQDDGKVRGDWQNRQNLRPGWGQDRTGPMNRLGPWMRQMGPGGQNGRGWGCCN